MNHVTEQFKELEMDLYKDGVENDPHRKMIPILKSENDPHIYFGKILKENYTHAIAFSDIT